MQGSFALRRRSVMIIALLVCATAAGAGFALAQGPQPKGLAAAPGTAFTYQGQLKSGGAPVNGACDFQFALYDAPALGARIGATQSVNSLAVSNGLFTAPLDFGAGALNGDARFVNIEVRCPASAGAFSALTPRQALTPAPLALALPGLWTQQNGSSPSLIGGYSGNVISPGVVGGTIGGGGLSGQVNRVTGNFGTVGGGESNTASGPNTTVGGGMSNTASLTATTVAGGQSNLASGVFATVGGGHDNQATNSDAVIGGGAYNVIIGDHATVAGGLPI